MAGDIQDATVYIAAGPVGLGKPRGKANRLSEFRNHVVEIELVVLRLIVGEAATEVGEGEPRVESNCLGVVGNGLIQFLFLPISIR
jgi:hypothetical protein